VQGLRLLNFTSWTQMLRQHNGFVSIFERAVQTSNQENKPELKLVRNADMTTVPDSRR
jgi:hypothetical protein